MKGEKCGRCKDTELESIRLSAAPYPLVPRSNRTEHLVPRGGGGGWGWGGGGVEESGDKRNMEALRFRPTKQKRSRSVWWLTLQNREGPSRGVRFESASALLSLHKLWSVNL